MFNEGSFCCLHQAWLPWSPLYTDLCLGSLWELSATWQPKFARPEGRDLSLGSKSPRFLSGTQLGCHVEMQKSSRSTSITAKRQGTNLWSASSTSSSCHICILSHSFFSLLSSIKASQHSLLKIHKTFYKQCLAMHLSHQNHYTHICIHTHIYIYIYTCNNISQHIILDLK